MANITRSPKNTSVEAATKSPSRVWRLFFTSLGILLSVVIVLAAGFYSWATHPLPADGVALAAMTSDAHVTLENGDWIVFRPTQESTTGLIFYPGARVDPAAYAPLLRPLADQGFLVVMPRMTLNLAVFSPDVAGDVIAAYPQITHWVVAGHSLGGTMAAQFVATHLEEVDGLVFWASYPAGGVDLTASSLKVLSIYGTQDGLATPEKVLAVRAQYPADAVFLAIEGGNHAGFGSYGEQDGDLPASISQSEQHTHITAATLNFLDMIANGTK